MTLSLSSPHEIKYPVFPGSSVTVTYVHSMSRPFSPHLWSTARLRMEDGGAEPKRKMTSEVFLCKEMEI